MDSFSKSDPPRKPSHTESEPNNYGKTSLDSFLEPYQPNNTEFNETINDTEVTHETIATALAFGASPTQNDNPTSFSGDQPLPPSKYASVTEFTEEYWKERKQKMLDLKEAEMQNKTKNMSVPMARVKKIMRIDEDVKNFMISSDAPIFMAQAAEFFIEEMTGMGWQFVSESRRRILQRNDIAAAVKKNDQFDFLIDFLPQNQSVPPPPNPTTFNPLTDRNPLHVHKEEKPTNGAGPSMSAIENLRNQQMKRSEERKKREAVTSRMASDRFKCVLNETPSGNEYQILEVPRSSVPTTSAPSTSTETRRFSAPRTSTEGNGTKQPSTSE